MNLKTSLRRRACAVVCVATLVLAPVSAHSADTKVSSLQSSVVDVKLHDGGTLVGAILKADGTAVKGSQVQLLQHRRVVAKLQTNEKGQFFVQGVRGGVYELQTDHGSGLCRLWAPNTAPPAAQEAVVLTSQPQVVRGQGQRAYTLFDANSLTYQALVLGMGAGGLTTGIIALQDEKDGELATGS